MRTSVLENAQENLIISHFHGVCSSRLEKSAICPSGGHLNIQTIPDEMISLQTFENTATCRVERVPVRQESAALTFYAMVAALLLCGGIIRFHLSSQKSFSV